MWTLCRAADKHPYSPHISGRNGRHIKPRADLAASSWHRGRLFAGSATLAIAQTSPPDKSKSEAGAPQQGPGQEVPKAGTGTGAGTGGTAMPAPGTPPNPTGITQEKQKSEANDPQQGGKKN
jgi:hypothetical protein